MGGWRTRRNDFPTVIRRMRVRPGQAVDDAASELVAILTPIVWVDTGVLRSTVDERERGKLHVTVGVGLNPARFGGNPAGFYAAFQEFGTSRQAPRPIVGPAAMNFETRYPQIMAAAVREACDV